MNFKTTKSLVIGLMAAFSAMDGLAQTPASGTPPQIAASASKAEMVDYVIKMMRDNRLFKLLLSNVPAFEGELRTRIDIVMTSYPQDQWSIQAAILSHSLVEKYFAVYAPKASDASIYALLKFDHDNLLGYVKDPKTCVGYFQGSPEFMMDAPADYIARVTDLKADMFESAFMAPKERPDMSRDKVLEVLHQAYVSEGFNPDDMGLLGNLAGIPAEDGCRAITEFNDAIYLQGPVEGPNLMAQLTRLSQ